MLHIVLLRQVQHIVVGQPGIFGFKNVGARLSGFRLELRDKLGEIGHGFFFDAVNLPTQQIKIGCSGSGQVFEGATHQAPPLQCRLQVLVGQCLMQALPHAPAHWSPPARFTRTMCSSAGPWARAISAPGISPVVLRPVR